MDDDGRIGFRDLTEPQRTQLKAWRENYLSGKGPSGLWCYGKRAAGSSSIAVVAYWRAVEDLKCVGQQITAIDLSDAVRSEWSSGQLSRSLPSDYDLFLTAMGDEVRVDRIWQTEVLLVDDVYSTALDMTFWNRHVQPRLEQRVKNGLITIVATDMTAEHRFFSDITDVLKQRFVFCHAGR